MDNINLLKQKMQQKQNVVPIEHQISQQFRTMTQSNPYLTLCILYSISIATSLITLAIPSMIINIIMTIALWQMRNSGNMKQVKTIWHVWQAKIILVWVTLLITTFIIGFLYVYIQKSIPPAPPVDTYKNYEWNNNKSQDNQETIEDLGSVILLSTNNNQNNMNNTMENTIEQNEMMKDLFGAYNIPEIYELWKPFIPIFTVCGIFIIASIVLQFVGLYKICRYYYKLHRIRQYPQDYNTNGVTAGYICMLIPTGISLIASLWTINILFLLNVSIILAINIIEMICINKYLSIKKNEYNQNDIW